jgi:hypothetical protein
MTWTWRMDDSAGATLSIPSTAHVTQSDAESWLGEHWRDLAEQGVAQVTLFEDDHLEYGPMSLSQAG